MKRAKITLILYFILIISLVVLSIKLASNNGVSLLVLFTLLIGTFTFKRYEANKLAEQIREPFQNKEYSSVIKVLKNSYNELIVYGNCLSALITLVVVSMLNNDIKEVEKLIEKNKVLKNNRNTCYINMLIALYNEKMYTASGYYRELIKFHDPRFRPQQEAAKLIMKMALTKEYNPEIEEKSQYPIVREICQRYKKNQDNC